MNFSVCHCTPLLQFALFCFPNPLFAGRIFCRLWTIFREIFFYKIVDKMFLLCFDWTLIVLHWKIFWYSTYSGQHCIFKAQYVQITVTIKFIFLVQKYKNLTFI